MSSPRPHEARSLGDTAHSRTGDSRTWRWRGFKLCASSASSAVIDSTPSPTRSRCENATCQRSVRAAPSAGSRPGHRAGEDRHRVSKPPRSTMNTADSVSVAGENTAGTDAASQSGAGGSSKEPSTSSTCSTRKQAVIFAVSGAGSRPRAPRRPAAAAFHRWRKRLPGAPRGRGEVRTGLLGAELHADVEGVPCVLRSQRAFLGQAPGGRAAARRGAEPRLGGRADGRTRGVGGERREPDAEHADAGEEQGAQ